MRMHTFIRNVLTKKFCSGIVFPDFREADAMFTTAMMASKWEDSCYQCKTAFSLLNRKVRNRFQLHLQQAALLKKAGI